MQSRIFVAFLLTFVLAQEEPETKELFGSRRKINLVNNVLHSTVRKILRPYRNKIPRTFTKNTRVYHGNQTFCHFSSNSIKSSADDSMIFVFKNVYCTRVSFLLQCTARREHEIPKKASGLQNFCIACRTQEKDLGALHLHQTWKEPFILPTQSLFPLNQQFNSLPIQRPFPFPIHLIHFQPQELDLHPTHLILIPSLFLLTHPIPTQFLSQLTQYPFQMTQYPSLPTLPSLNPQALFPPRLPPAPSPSTRPWPLTSASPLSWPPSLQPSTTDRLPTS